MPKLTPQESADKWARNLGASTADISAGIDRVTTAPGAQAAAKADKWLQRTMDSQPKWKTRVASVSLSEWQSAAKAGVSRVSSGAQAKKGKQQAFAEEFFPHLERGQATIRSMPNNTTEDGIARAVAMIRHNANFKRSK
jgi:hypothetical protein